MDAEKRKDLTIGTKLRQRRKQLGKTLQTVAEEAGLSVSFISQIERDLSSPSLSSLVSLSRVLGVGVESFIRSPVKSGPVTRQGQRSAYTTGATSPLYERVSDEIPGGVLNSVIMSLPPHYVAEEISHEGEELMFVLTGRIFATVDGDTRLLEAGDSVHFLSHLPHRTENPDDTPARVLWVGTLRIFENGRLVSPRLGDVDRYGATGGSDGAEPGRGQHFSEQGDQR